MMNKEQQDKLWNDLPEEYKSCYSVKYKRAKSLLKDDPNNFTAYEVIRAIVPLFGEHNLDPKPQVKTWEDVEKEGYKIFDDYRGENISNDYLEFGNYCDCICLQGYDYDLDREKPDNKIILKAIATLKIAKLIDLFYGGIVSEEEWKFQSEKYVIGCFDGKIKGVTKIGHYHFIAFHTLEQREEFMSHESNRQLVKQYYMM